MLKNINSHKKKLIGVGIIGTGRMAEFHLNVFKKIKGVKILAISSTSKGLKRRKIIKKKFKIEKDYSNYQLMIKQNSNINAIIIASKIDKNFNIAKFCIKNKKHCLIEKPPALKLNEVKHLISLKRKNNIIVCTGLQRRFYGNFLKIKKIIQTKSLKSISIEAPENYKEILNKNKFSKNVLNKWVFANGIHCIDLFRYFSGEIKKIYSYNKKFYFKNHFDSINSVLHFKNGTIGTYKSNWFSPGSWSVKLYFKDFLIDSTPLENSKIIFQNGKKKEITKTLYDRKFKPGLFLQNLKFIESIKKKKILGQLCELEDAYKTMNICSKIAKYKK